MVNGRLSLSGPLIAMCSYSSIADVRRVWADREIAAFSPSSVNETSQLLIKAGQGVARSKAWRTASGLPEGEVFGG
jgi:hypothetical protein